jgi:hypothetical protein
MERERYRRMRAVLREVAQRQHDNPRVIHSNSTILLVALWAALHDKPISWATLAMHWPGDLRPRGGLPSQSCMSRRLRGVGDSCGIFILLERWQRRLRGELGDSEVKLIDGRGLRIGGCGKDPDAGFGYSAGVLARGYKLHWIIDCFSGAVDGWLVAPMNYAEQSAAKQLIAHLPPHTRWVLGDNSYDRNELYQQAAQQHVQWLAMPRRDAAGLGHHRHSDWRLRVQPWLRSRRGQRTMKRRIVIEQVNGRLGCCSVGLNHLPHHARRLHRVTLWIALKLLILTDLQILTQRRRCA